MILVRNILKLKPNLTFRNQVILKNDSIRLICATSRYFKQLSKTTMANTAVDINWEITCDEIKTKTETVIKETTARCDQIAAVKEFTPRNVLAPFNEMERIFSRESSTLYLLSKTSPDKSIRDACNDSVAAFNKFSIEIKMRKDLFDVLQKFSEVNTEELDAESKRYLQRSITEGKQDGLHLDEETRNKVKELKTKLSDLQLKFSKNVTEEKAKFAFTKEELNGVPEDTVNTLEKSETGEYLATLKYPVYFPIMKNCNVPSTRHKMFVEFNSRCIEENTPIFEEILQLRHELANILGYKTFSEYALELCMAKHPDNVRKFLDDLTVKLKKLLLNETQILLKYKKDECEKLNIPFDGKINQSDVTYYSNLREQLEFKIDHIKLQQYFPMDVVLNGIFDIYQTLLGLEFEYVSDAVNFHEDVKLYQVKDKETKELLGYFYTDMHPREGKYGHAAVFPIINGCQRMDGQRQHPVCAMVCNFTKATSEKPALLTHDEVETFFHEFGHVMHQICAKANYTKFSGTKVERDFVEAPSQMLENWVWEKESLKLMSKHYKDGTPIDETLLDDLLRSKTANAGYFNLRQILFATIDQIFHQNPKSDTKAVYHQNVKELLLMNVEHEKTNMVSSFEHIVGGYESKYYSYLWSEVFSQDMFDSRFKKEGILSPKTGSDYRRYILQPGGSKDATEMLVNFLGREPSTEPFLKSKGLTE